MAAPRHRRWKPECELTSLWAGSLMTWWNRSQVSVGAPQRRTEGRTAGLTSAAREGPFLPAELRFEAILFHNKTGLKPGI